MIGTIRVTFWGGLAMAMTMESVTTKVQLQAGQAYDIRAEFYENTADAAIPLATMRAPIATCGRTSTCSACSCAAARRW